MSDEDVIRFDNIDEPVEYDEHTESEPAPMLRRSPRSRGPPPPPPLLRHLLAAQVIRAAAPPPRVLFMPDGDFMDDNELEAFLHQSFEQDVTAPDRRGNIEIQASIEPYEHMAGHKYYDLYVRCCICLEAYSPFDICITLKCAHFFHEECITEWAQYQQHCPICRNLFDHANHDAARTI